jgi:hypothetical protein
LLSTSNGTSAMPADMVPPPGTNGQGQAYSALSARAHETPDADTDADNPPRSGPDHE